MTPEEKELLIRIDERTKEMHDRHGVCTIPDRVQALERKLDRIEGGVALLVLLVTLGRLYDYFPHILPKIFHDLINASIQTLSLLLVQLSFLP